jgi:predicted RNA methylase
MKQTGNTIQNENIQEFLDSAANALEQGQRQFFTPPAIAEILCRPLPAVSRQLIADLHFGSGSLAAASGARTALGLDIDARIRSELSPHISAAGHTSSGPPTWHVEQADITRWYPLAAEADLELPFILLNPPFSLQWHTDRLTALGRSSMDDVQSVYRAQGPHIDSTLASFLIALDRLTYSGEGFMICNANTARRFFGTPDPAAPDPAKHPTTASLMPYIWLWLEIPGMIYENQMTDFPTAVLYFSRSHRTRNHAGNPPHYLRAATSDPLSVERAILTPEVFTAHQGTRHRFEHEFNPSGTIQKFQAIAAEYAVLHRSRRPDWNIALDAEGRLRTHLTPFQKVSTRISPDLIRDLHALNLKTPIALCVTATSRTALRAAAQCGFWRIQPAVHTAIAAAIAEFEAQGAPFYTPSATQSLGWVDEQSTLKCLRPGIGDCIAGESYSIACKIEQTVWEGLKTNLAGEEETLKYQGRELLVTLTDTSGVRHHFHVRKDEKLHSPETSPSGRITALHWHIADLLSHFEIPIPQDIVTLRPQEYQAHLATLQTLEERICQNLLKQSA